MRPWGLRPSWRAPTKGQVFSFSSHSFLHGKKKKKKVMILNPTTHCITPLKQLSTAQHALLYGSESEGVSCSVMSN